MFCCNVTRCACGMHFDGVLAFLQYFSKAMQTKYGEYHILSSDLSSKVQVKIRSKVRGLFKRHFVWTGRFFVEFSWRSENSRWKASFRSIVFKISLWTIVNRGDAFFMKLLEYRGKRIIETVGSMFYLLFFGWRDSTVAYNSVILLETD